MDKTSREKLIDKVKALFSKTTANGCTEEEMLSSLAKARALIDSYEITDDELKLSREEKAILRDETEEDARDTHGIKGQLGSAVARYCRVRIYRDSSKAGLTFVGFKADIDWAAWLIDHLADFVHDHLFEFMLDCLVPNGKERNREIRSFVFGCTERISARMIEISDQSKAEHTTNGKALVVIKDQAIKDFMEAESICLQSRSSSSSNISDGARATGQSAGDRASFGRPVAGAVLRIGKGNA
jgi:hypothetical protein